MFRQLRFVTAAGLLAGGLLFLYLTFAPSGLDAFFGDDDTEPLAGFMFLGITMLRCIGFVQWSRLRWVGIAVIVLGIAFWVPFTINTTPPGPSPLFVLFYGLSAMALAASLVLEPAARP